MTKKDWLQLTTPASILLLTTAIISLPFIAKEQLGKSTIVVKQNLTEESETLRNDQIRPGNYNGWSIRYFNN